MISIIASFWIKLKNPGEVNICRTSWCWIKKLALLPYDCLISYRLFVSIRRKKASPFRPPDGRKNRLFWSNSTAPSKTLFKAAKQGHRGKIELKWKPINKWRRVTDWDLQYWCRWVSRSIKHPHIKHPHINILKKYKKKHSFWPDHNGSTNGWTDKASNKVARPQLMNKICLIEIKIKHQ